MEFPRYKCDDGHYVRSRAEMLIDNWLYRNNYQHAYEILVHLPNNPEITMYCDFFLPQQGLYIEFSGLMDNDSYANRRVEKCNLYHSNHLPLLELTDGDLEKLERLPRLIKARVEGD